MAVDTERKRWGMMQWASGPAYYPTLFNPDTSGVDATERATVLKLYGGIAWDGPAAECSVSGGPYTEQQIRDGGESIVLTLTYDTWVATVGDDNAITTALINGIDSDGAEATGWDAVVKAGLGHGDVTRDSDTQVTITLPVFASYDITANETVTATIPATALTGATETVATPTFTVTFVAEASTSTGGGLPPGALKRIKNRKPRKPEWEKRDEEQREFEQFLERTYKEITGEAPATPEQREVSREAVTAVRPYSQGKGRRPPAPSKVDFAALARNAAAANELVELLERKRAIDEEEAIMMVLM